MSLPFIFLEFGMRGNAAPHLLEGWSLAEILGRWNDGLRCALILPPIPYRGPMQLVLAANPLHRPPEIVRQRMTIEVNRRWLGEVELTQSWALERIALVRQIPAGAIRDSTANRIDFSFPDAAILPTDSRRLAFYFKYLALEPIAPNRGHSLGPDRIASLDQEREPYNDLQKEFSAQITAARHLGELQQALELCDNASCEFPNWGEPGRLKSEILTELMRPSDARSAIEQAIAAEPANHLLLMNSASLAVVYRQWDRAIWDIRKFLRQVRDAEWPWMLLAQVFREIRWLDLAAGACRRLRLRQVTKPDWIRELERITDSFQRNRTELRRHLTLRKSRRLSTDEILAVADGLCRIGRPKTAIRLLASAGQVSAIPEAYRIIADAMRRCQSPNEAIEIAAIPARMNFSDRNHEFQRAKLLYETGHYTEAARILGGLVEQADPNPTFLDLFCTCLFMKQDFAQIEAVYRRWELIQPGVGWPSQWALTALIASGRQKLIRGIPESEPLTELRSSIPPLLFQYWNTEKIPLDVGCLMRAWAERNSDFEHVVFDRAAARNFLGTNFERAVLGAFDLCHHPAMEADLIRLAFLAVNGGVYVDADEQCRMPLTRLLSMLDGQSFVASLCENLPVYVNNWFLCATPGHDIIRNALYAAVRIIHSDHANGRRTDIWQGTGPGQLTRSIVKHILNGGRSDVALLSARCYERIGGSTDDLGYKRGAGDWRR